MTSIPRRIRGISNTAVPLPFDIFATLKTVKYEIVEKKIHKTIDRLTDLRIRQNREFFNIKPELALEILRDEATILDDAEITLYKNNVPISENLEEDHGEETEHRKRLPVMTRLNTKAAYSNCRPSLDLTCQRKSAMPQELIKGLSSSLTMGRFLMMSEQG